MATTLLDTARHTACPAYDYCRAAESYGASLTSSASCYLEKRDAQRDAQRGNRREGGSEPKDEGSAQHGTQHDTQRDGQRDEEWLPVPLTDNKAQAQAQTNRPLIKKLLALAAQARTRFDCESRENNEVETLIAAFSSLFAARLALWEAMIGATRDGRKFTDVELDHYQQAIANAQAALDTLLSTADSAVALRALCAHDHGLKERYALQFDPQMIEDINSIVGNIVNTRPTLIVGDKGIAKTQVAKFVMGLYGSDPIIVSVKGDMMSDELIGKIKHDRVNNTFVFQEGMLLTAMRTGLPILLDEINFGDQAIIARLQDILLRRPGEAVSVQESDGEPLVIQPGFAVIATANEASQRYRHREILDPAIRDRFSIVMRSYPDMSGDPIADLPPRLLRLALSSAVDRWGTVSRHIDLRMLEGFVRLAHATEYLYSVPAKDVALDIDADTITSSVIEESQPLMTDCITPRTLSKLIADCAQGNLPNTRLDTKLVLRTIRSLDQAGSTHNLLMAHQVRLLLDIGTDGSLPLVAEGGAAITEFIDLDDEGFVGLDVPADAAAGTGIAAGTADAPGTPASGSFASPTAPGGFSGLSQRAIKAILSDAGGRQGGSGTEAARPR
jgi:hypothetical protein